MEKRQREVLLIDNLMNRLEYNRNNKTWKLSGCITQDEMEALSEMLREYRRPSK